MVSVARDAFADPDVGRARLLELGIRVTAPRLAVLNAVAERPHSDADAVARAVRERLGTVSTQAVYDTLALFSAEGLLRRIAPAGSPARYETRVGDNHHHVTCRVCGAMADVDCAVGQVPCLTPADSHGYVIDEADVIYWGLCPSCQHAQPTDQPQPTDEPESTDKPEPTESKE